MQALDSIRSIRIQVYLSLSVRELLSVLLSAAELQGYEIEYFQFIANFFKQLHELIIHNSTQTMF